MFENEGMHEMLNRNNSFYAFLLNVCQLVHEVMLVTEKKGRYRFRSFLEDENKMGLMFQAFLFNFFKIEQKYYQVNASRMKWDATGDSVSMALMPMMQTDITLRSKSRTIVIEAKFTDHALQVNNFGKSTFFSKHLYQIYA